ncbi:hypothetical protein LTR91_025089 [Friedmanniomyces endolithicus]|uniref:Uncharacterized protein n=1 Tax=Friedmanniomyces endolithicus TaxID=329885 RepID=A0AAN6JWW5_9PEZI|nr:hypothetical protein LTR57_020372 [Friedmanniomyces endolithicus]KAK0951278.1 hypothetical protein LTR91_025089 [Friedmanniomyces endolithicus]KAK0963851.1 hypothetical protein LTS01_019130 [Friedmanniomyces endolithicus]KAK1041922.1 hypothetical protein LTS16_009292 [Friedmanniomyces endolithicus]
MPGYPSPAYVWKCRNTRTQTTDIANERYQLRHITTTARMGTISTDFSVWLRFIGTFKAGSPSSLLALCAIPASTSPDANEDRGSFGVALLGEVIERAEIVELPAQDSGQSLSAKALRDLDQQHRSRRLAPIREPYNLSYGELPLGHEPPVEPKVLITPTHRPAHSSSSGTTLVDYHLDAVELPGSPPPVHRRSIPLMEAVNYRLSSYSSYKHEGFDEYDLPVELEGDGSTGVYELPTPHPYSVQAASTTAGTDVSAAKTRHAWHFGERFAPRRALDGWNTEVGKRHFGRSISEDRRKWVIIGVVSLLIVTIIVTATVGGALG